MTAASFTPAGPFSLAASIRFLEGFTPASYDRKADGVLRWAFPSDDAQGVIGCALRQEGEAADGQPGAVEAEFTVHAGGAARTGDTGAGSGDAAAGAAAARAQIERILSLDVDGTGFSDVAAADPVVAGLQADYLGLRPVCFCSPYEAAVWTVIGNRIRMSQAAAVKAGVARRHGQAVDVAGERLHAFPAPAVLRSVDHVPGLTGTKVERLHAIADAALDGRLDAATLRAQESGEALAALRELPGIGPFSAELILIRGAGHPDVFPVAEPRVHRALARAYGLGQDAAADLGRLAEIADRWRPYRSWVSVLLRVRAQELAAAGR